MSLEGLECGKNSLPLSFATECSATERPPKCLLRSRHEAADAHRLSYHLGQGEGEEQVRAILHCPYAQQALHEGVRNHALLQGSHNQAPSWKEPGEHLDLQRETTLSHQPAWLQGAHPPRPPGPEEVGMQPGRRNEGHFTPTHHGLPSTGAGWQGAPAD